MKSDKRQRARRKVTPLVLRLYRAAKKFSDGCYDNFGSEAADNGIYENHIDWKAKDALDKVLAEFETPNSIICVNKQS
jgi:hypothetical protein